MRVPARTNDDGQFVASWGSVSHFHESEMACKCGCGDHLVSMDLLDGLERLRGLIGSPITIISGVRCKNHNATIRGAAPHSQHISDLSGVGNAVDIKATGVETGRLYINSLKISYFRGRGLRKESLHLDSRESAAGWMYGAFKGNHPEAWIAGLIEESLNR